MTKFYIDINNENIECWKQYTESLAEKAIGMAAEKGITMCDIIVTDNEAFSGLYDCVEKESIFCWGILWDIIERNLAVREGEK